MLNQSRSTWRNWLTWLVVAGVLVSTSLSIIFIREPAKSTYDTQAPVSISPCFLQDYALLSIPVRTDSKSYKFKGSGTNTTGLALAENKKVAYSLLHFQNLFEQSLGRMTNCFAETDTTSHNWLQYACNLLDLPPPPPTNFIESL